MSWLLESPIPAIVFGFMFGGVLAVLFFQTGKTLFLKLVAGVLLLTIVGLVAQAAIVTDREQVNDTLSSIAKSLEASDKPAVLNGIHTNKQDLRKHVEMLLSQAKVRKVKITSSEVTLNQKAPSNTALVDVYMKVSGSVGGIGATEDFPVRLLVDLVQGPDGNWLITNYDRVDLIKKTPIGEFQH